MKRKLNVKKLIIFIIVVLTIFYGSYKWVKDYIYSGSIEGKLTLKGYNEDDITFLIENLNDKEINKILEKKYNKNYVNFIKEKYFIFDNLEKYISYSEKNEELSFEKVVAIINTGANEEWYENIFDSNLSDEESMLVNKFYTLNTYSPEDLIEIDLYYAFDDVFIREIALESFESLCDAAKNNDITLVASLGYRSYQEQENTYSNYRSYFGTREADNTVARPGHSEHQTGLALEIEPYGVDYEDATETKEYKWLIKNAYKYGFIQRYPEGKEDITGYEFEPWHYRYVGTDVSVKLYREKITYDEYYAYYLKGKENEQ